MSPSLGASHPSVSSPSAAHPRLLTPASSPPETPQDHSNIPSKTPSETSEEPTSRNMSTNDDASVQEVAAKIEDPASSQKLDTDKTPDPKAKTTKSDCTRRKHKHKSKKKSKRVMKQDSSSESSSSEDEDTEDDLSDSESSSSSDDSVARRKHKKKKKKTKSKSSKKKAKSKHTAIDSDESDSSEDEEWQGEKRRLRKKKQLKLLMKRRTAVEESDSSDEAGEDATQEAQLAAIQAQIAALTAQAQGIAQVEQVTTTKSKKSKHRIAKSKKRAALDYKRVDQLWDSTIHNFKLVESAEDQQDDFEEYLFTVRRRFDWENKYKGTVVDVKSKMLREALQDVMKDAKGVSLVEDKPSVDPNMLFLYLEELRAYKKTLKAHAKTAKKTKDKKRFKLMQSSVKVLVSYLDKDYDDTKKTLYPMLQAGNITFDLLWALFKPNTIAYTTTYGSIEDPRCFKVDYAMKESNFMRGEWYVVQGRYLEYDGKSFGLGDFGAEIDSFKGPRKITSLATYPLQYHQDPEGIKKQIIERGKTFVSLRGMNYKLHKGMAFQKKKKAVAKININGRIMVDPSLFRRIQPNYPISHIKPKIEFSVEDDDDDDDEDGSNCCCESSSDEACGEGPQLEGEHKERSTRRYMVVKGKDDKMHVVEVPADGEDIEIEQFDKLPETDDEKDRAFSEEALLIASPVVLGFAFSEKLWLEFTISGLKEIEWNEDAFPSLVLPENQKSIVKALVESHKFHAAKTIDDVVQGKGRGLVAVLHGPPGTGKTLTAEGIAELLRCPLYMVSAGELGTDPRVLEHELQKILDIAHAWGAVLLLDEADVFLEKREVHDIHRNALVSIFLRLLEYFQGILFLTTNRVETFDDAFQSRIHVALKYGELSHAAKKTVWKMFLQKVMDMEKAEVDDDGNLVNGVCKDTFTDIDFEDLAKKNMNGRQIKNAVRTAQALAVNEKQKLNLKHIKRVLDVAESFAKDLKGGSGFDDALRSYM